jgi:hypothetical protein
MLEVAEADRDATDAAIAKPGTPIVRVNELRRAISACLACLSHGQKPAFSCEPDFRLLRPSRGQPPGLNRGGRSGAAIPHRQPSGGAR